jgi:tripeptidyl-peptidase-2
MSRCTLLLAGITLLCGNALAQTDHGWSQLSLSTCGVDAFLAAHPEANGKGVVIAVLDTGVDPSIPGLTTLPDGGVKVIDVQDFTGQGDVDLLRVRYDAEAQKLIRYDDDGAPIEYAPPDVSDDSAGGEERLWWFGTLDEHKFIHSGQADINDNSETEDEFPILVTALAGDGSDQAVAYVDTNLDRSFADEKPLRSYRLRYDTFTFVRARPEAQTIPLTFAVNIFLRQQKIVVHFDDGAHGTHVAGIAAGYRINNQPDFHGVAPGAKLMSLKIGNNALGGISTTGSMRDALRYAARYMRETGTPVVCNLSFGVESEIESHSDIDKVVDEVCRENPGLIFCTSGGNSGPGLSTIGTPAAATHALTVGALMASDSARDVAGWALADTVVTGFSSRGGELDKPDIATPGWSTSTVPRWVTRGDFWAGTSMASPYAAGMCANLLSYAMQADMPRTPRAWDVRRALERSGRPLKGFTPFDYGWGVPDLTRAAEELEALLASDSPLMGYRIETASPQGYGGTGPVSYWRSTWFPADERQTFTVSPIFRPVADAAVRAEFTQRYTLRTDAPWIQLEQESVYLRSEQNARIYVEYDESKLRTRGLHVGTVEAVTDGRVAFRLVCAVIVPHEFTADTGFTQHFDNCVVDGWTPERWFIAVPPGASSMKITMRAPADAESMARMMYLYGPRGREYADYGARLDTFDGKREVTRTIAADLSPGVWELPVLADRPDKRWPYDLDVRFFGLHAAPDRIVAGDAEQPSGDLTVTNQFTTPVVASATGQIEGFRMHKEAEFEGLTDTLTYSLSPDGRFNRLRLRIELTPEAYATTTDIGVQVVGADDATIFQSAFDTRVLEATCSARGQTSLKVIITGGFAVADDQRKTPIDVKIDQLFSAPVAINVEYGDSADMTFVPGVPMELSYNTSSRLKDAPEGLRPVGSIRITERATGDEALVVPLDIGG